MAEKEISSGRIPPNERNPVGQEAILLFSEVITKLELAGYFLDNLRDLALGAGGLSYIKQEQLLERRANLDGFFFEIVSAKDFFLQKINDECEAGLPRDEATTKLGELKRRLTEKHPNASRVVGQIQGLLSRKHSWLWTLNNYRNSATHRELLHLGHEIKTTLEVDKALFGTIAQAAKEGTLKIIPFSRGQEQLFPPDIPKVYMPREDIKTYLFKDPDNPQKGNMDTELVPYCEQSLAKMRKFLEELYSQLDI